MRSSRPQQLQRVHAIRLLLPRSPIHVDTRRVDHPVVHTPRQQRPMNPESIAPDPQVANGTGDDAKTPQEAAAKAEMLMGRLKAGASFSELAMGYSEDAETAPRGGDLGFVPVSRLKQLPPALRNAVIGQEPGTINVAAAGGAHTLVLVIAHEQAGQRDLSTPAVRERITETLRGRKEQLFRGAYLTAARDDADVVNHFARQLLESGVQAPALKPAPAPGAK
jgi:hypothetical protein